jgi:beta-fructofuranosidase
MDLSAEVAARLAEGEAAVQRALSEDPHRPIYHFLPVATWMNDPNGLIQWKGQYHLFYQYNPNGAYWGTMHWGHATSPDLVHWTDLPVALAPTPGSPDEDGVFSGCAVDHDGTPTFIYTGVRGEEQLPCIATSADDLLTWQKHPGNPVIAAPPEELDTVMFRDHDAWREADRWYQVIGSGIRDVGGAAFLYRSPDLLRWEYIGPLCVGDSSRTEPLWTGSMWECPDFFKLGDRHVLVVSVRDEENLLYAAYLAGRYSDHAFTPEVLGYVDTAGSFYAPQTLLDDRGRRIMLGWLREGRSVEAQMASSLAGVMALPRVLSLSPEGTLLMELVPELERLRREHRSYEDVEIAPSGFTALPGAEGDCLEIVAEIEPRDAGRVGLRLFRSPDGEEETLVLYDHRNGTLTVDPSRSSLSPEVHRDAHSLPLQLDDAEPLRLRVFLDRSIVEVFANERACITARVYPTRPDSRDIGLFAKGGIATARRLDLWRMASIWEA